MDFFASATFLQKYFYSSSFESNYFSKEGPINKHVLKLKVFFIFALSFEAPSRPCYCRHSLVFEQCTKMPSFQHASLLCYCRIS